VSNTITIGWTFQSSRNALLFLANGIKKQKVATFWPTFGLLLGAPNFLNAGIISVFRIFRNSNYLAKSDVLATKVTQNQPKVNQKLPNLAALINQQMPFVRQ